ncbi:hypothetical protein J4772_03885 [Cohnella sp. LGH]|uniref:hypothetical protein n=1 Tax=Cohnella sp. LGH TaxID=1619153 RepID=UPI001AD9A6FA|nr:hypothetical protein [Cohnella sp. LGH]QTH43585.1 hypothetical protein J4772_03885 [Cohnella sp. LGH]
MKKKIASILLGLACLWGAASPAFALSANQTYDYGDVALSGIVNDDKYDWGAAVIRNGDKYQMWWTRQDPHDSVYYAESLDGLHWYDLQRVLMPAENAWESIHVADPSVVIVGGTYYMFYEAPRSPYQTCTPEGYDNAIFMATSTDGKTWNKYPSNSDPQPVVRQPVSTYCSGVYGVGQPQVLYRNGQFEMYYTFVAHPDSLGRNDVARAVSSDGINWGASENHAKVLKGGGADVKFSPLLNKYVMVYTLNNQVGRTNPPPDSAFTYDVHLLTSDDGVSWTGSQPATMWDAASASNSITVGAPRATRTFANFLTDGQGNIPGDTFHIYYMEGQIHLPSEDFKNTASTWDLRVRSAHIADLPGTLAFMEGMNVKTSSSGSLYRMCGTQKCAYVNWGTYEAINGSRAGDYVTVPANLLDPVPGYKYYLEGLNIKRPGSSGIEWVNGFTRYGYTSWASFLAYNNNDGSAYFTLTDEEYDRVEASLPYGGTRP